MLVDPTTGVTEFIGTGLGITAFNPGLAYDPFTRRLYLLTEPGELTGGQSPLHDLYAIHVDTGIASLIGTMTTEKGNVGLAFNWTDRKLYATFGFSPIPTNLYTIDAVTAQPALIGNTGATELAGLEYDPELGTLFASDSQNRRLYTIDPVTAAATLIGTHGLNNLEGLAVQAALPREEGVLTVLAPGVLTNDGDPDGDPLTATLVTGPTHGTLTLNADGAFTYTPQSDFSGTDVFTYTANDGDLDSNMATVTITVVINNPPTITSTAVTTAVVEQLYSYDVDAADPDVGDTLTYSLPTFPTGMTINPTTGLIQWTPTAGQIGDHPVTVRVQDNGGLFATQSFTIMLPQPNRPPQITSTAVTTATVSVLDRRGKRLGTVYLGHMPEPGQGTLTTEFTALLHDILRQVDSQSLRLVYVTDEGYHPSDYYHSVLKTMQDPRRLWCNLAWIRIVDYYHACQYIPQRAEAIFGPGTASEGWAKRMRKQ